MLQARKSVENANKTRNDSDVNYTDNVLHKQTGEITVTDSWKWKTHTNTHTHTCLRITPHNARPQTQHDCHHDMKVKPEAATAVIELLMMGGKTPETC